MEHVPDGAEFKDTIQLGQLKYLLDLVHDIYQLQPNCIGISPLP